MPCFGDIITDWPNSNSGRLKLTSALHFPSVTRSCTAGHHTHITGGHSKHLSNHPDTGGSVRQLYMHFAWLHTPVFHLATQAFPPDGHPGRVFKLLLPGTTDTPFCTSFIIAQSRSHWNEQSGKLQLQALYHRNEPIYRETSKPPHERCLRHGNRHSSSCHNMLK